MLLGREAGGACLRITRAGSKILSCTFKTLSSAGVISAVRAHFMKSEQKCVLNVKPHPQLMICSPQLHGHRSPFHYAANKNVMKYLQFFHLPLDADTVQMLRAVRQLGEAPLSGTQPLTEGRAEAIGVLDAPQLLLQLLDGVLHGGGFRRSGIID